MQSSKMSHYPGRARALLRLGALMAAAFLFLYGGAGWAQAPGSGVKGAPPAAPAHDGQHDFDFLLGSWKIHLKRMVHPLSGAHEWVEFDGTVVCKPVWGGKGEVEEFSVDAPEKKIHILGLALRLYNPSSHQWSIYWANAAKGAIGGPPVVGEFKGGHGEFYDQEEIDGRVIFTRYAWSRIDTPTPHFEQAYSDDGGRTWEVNWITEQTKVNPQP
jgi:hypothetical protein